MSNPEHWQLFGNPKQWNAWRQPNPDIVPDLRESDVSSLGHLDGRDVHDVDWSGADLSYMEGTIDE